MAVGHPLQEVEQALRALVATRGLRAFDRDTWTKLSLALDTLGDASRALATVGRYGFGRTPGAQWLRALGCLQALGLLLEATRVIGPTIDPDWREPTSGAWPEVASLLAQTGRLGEAGSGIRLRPTPEGFVLKRWTDGSPVPRTNVVNLGKLATACVAEVGAMLGGIAGGRIE